jgi:predicted acylesterase/phospholipase RssA
MCLMVSVSVDKMRIGSFVNFNEHTTHDDLIKVLQASVSFPGVFSPIEAFGSMWFSK